MDFKFLKKKTETTGNLSYLNTNSDFQDTKFARGNVSTEFLSKKGSWSFGGSFEHNLKNFNQTKTLDVTSFSWKEVFIQKKIGDSLRTKLLAKSYFRTNDSVRDNSLKKMNNILGFLLESQLIKTEKTQLSTRVH